MSDNCAKIESQYGELRKKVDSFKKYAVDFRKNRENAVAVKKEIAELMNSLYEFLPSYFPPELKAAVEEVFHSEAMDKIRMPKLEELTNEYFDRMYPVKQRKEDTARGLVSFRPSWWNQKTDESHVGTAEETSGNAFIRSMRGEAKQFRGKTLLTESIQKPNSIDGSQQYGTKEGTDATKDPMLTIIQEVFGEKANRFDHSWNQLTEKLLPTVKKKITDKLKSKGLAVPEFKVILTPAIVSNQQMTNLRPENSKTNPYEWTSTVLLKQDGSETASRLAVGDSDDGGAACVDSGDRADGWYRRGFRLSVVSGRKTGY